MEKQVLFSEVQSQTMKWTWFLILIVALVLIIGAVQQLVFNKPFGTHPAPDWAFIPLFALVGFFLFLLYSTRLKTEITEDGISYRFPPFISKTRTINWDEVDRAYIRIYSPIKEYGGWGYRPAINKEIGKAFNVRGKVGIQLELKDGQNILLGTQKGKEAEEVLKSIKSINS